MNEYYFLSRLPLATNPSFSVFKGVLGWAAKRRIMLWSRWMPARQTRCALGYPCHLQHLKFVPRRFPCLLPSHRWGRRQTAPRHAKLVASGLNTLPKLGRPFVHSIFKHMVVPVRSEANFFHLVWMKEKIRRERGVKIN